MELEVQRRSLLVFDISEDDLQYWRSRGIAHNHWLPVTFFDDSRPSIPWKERAYDVLFLGNLHTPSNCFGVEWFLSEVVPRLERRTPSLRICIAGSAPSPRIRTLLLRPPSITTQFDVSDPAKLLSSARVLINPVFAGSGVNVKSAEMLFFDSPIVTTRVGVRGFPDWIKDCFLTAESASTFADFITGELTSRAEYVADSLRARARRSFGPEAMSKAMQLMAEALISSKSPRAGVFEVDAGTETMVKV
jgi:hypothetical protein